MYKLKQQRQIMAYETLDKKPKRKRQVKKNLKKKNVARNFLRKIRLLIFCYCLAAFVLPFTFQNIWGNLFLNRWHNSAIEFNAADYTNESAEYLTKNSFLGSIQVTPFSEKPLMEDMYDAGHIHYLENELTTLAKKYPIITPHIFVWDYTSGKSVKINSDTTVPTASIIKVPILFELFRRVDKGLLNLDDKMQMTDEFLTSGSGHLQYQQSDQYLSLERLAQLMIQDSDNTATNMLLSQIGGMNSLNRNTKNWGVPRTNMGNWLPDLAGTNVTTAESMGKILYNLDNPELLSLKSRSKIVDIMSNVKNIYLIQAGIGRDAQFIHKTGNIGSMIGDVGIVEMPNGHKYIVVIMVDRPHNYHAAKDFIIESARTIYNYMAVNS